MKKVEEGDDDREAWQSEFSFRHDTEDSQSPPKSNDLNEWMLISSFLCRISDVVADLWGVSLWV